jgi:integrase
MVSGVSGAWAWRFAYVAAVLAFFCGMRPCEIKGLQWKHIDFDRWLVQIRRSKTPAGWPDPTVEPGLLDGFEDAL